MRFPKATTEGSKATAVVLALLLFLTACGVSRTASPEALATDTTGQDTTGQDTTEQDTTATAEATADTTTTLPPTPTPSTAPAEDVAISVDFNGEIWELTHGELNAVVIPTWENQEFTTLAFGGPVPDGFYTGVAYEHFIGRILDGLLAEAGGSVTVADEVEPRAGLMTIMESWFAGTPDPTGEADRLYGEVPYLSFLIAQQAKQVALREALRANGDLTVPAPCVRHILLDDQAGAQEVRELLDGGADFATLAAERSTGPTGASGGDLGCSPSSNYVPEFAAAVDSATVGEYVGPIETQFGWHVLIVDGVEEAELNPAEVINQRLQGELESVISVDVDPRLGTWDAERLRIVPTFDTE